MKILSGGAAAAVVKAVQAEFERTTGLKIDGTFSAVGAMRDQLLAGSPCDLVILTQPLIAQLEASGHVVAGSARSLGRVHTGVAVKTGEPHPRVDSPDMLAAALKAASGIYFPDPKNATAGIHFMKVLTDLGLDQGLASVLHPHPNGATAMAAMASSGKVGSIGCTQVTEINYTEGVELVANLPSPYELATDYVLAICTGAKQPEQARVLADLLAGPASQAVRRQGGFQF